MIYKVEPKTKFLVPTRFVHSRRESSALYLCFIAKHVSLVFIQETSKPMHNSTAYQKLGIIEWETQVSSHSSHTQGLAAK